ncbi:MAG: hypothetical protein M1151_02285, partial [Candidatus Thermoplasmatota archaeon]|nr:hypothetical protein [Candidatus Thermoplasmatota archaeon]
CFLCYASSKVTKVQSPPNVLKIIGWALESAMTCGQAFRSCLIMSGKLGTAPQTPVKATPDLNHKAPSFTYA